MVYLAHPTIRLQMCSTINKPSAEVTMASTYQIACGGCTFLNVYAGATVSGMVHWGAFQHQQQQLQQY
jgi:hypothetical protein